MTNPPTVTVRALRKQFTIRNESIGGLKTLLLWKNRRSRSQFEVLKGVDFDCYPGECVSVIGRNGAGKSTLLAILARVYKPTSGEVTVNGRLAPLLELGAGFHPDLTGVENIVFNGVVLGLSRSQIRERMQSIIEFSELGAKVHQPVRSFSSGMLARLGFAVAIHVDADILLVDEVLSVGDFAFEQKCLERVDEFRKNGGTILMVSHHLDSVAKFSDRCIWLKNGQVEMHGEPTAVISAYLADREPT
jgi:ABC-type polysaccharide/polyol phosphate transport system ATPase subunit